MLKHLKLTNLGPAPSMELDFEERLNIITGDNGLGKSFLLDVAWWSLTRKWPSEINPGLTGGKMAIPTSDPAEIDFMFTGVVKPEEYTCQFMREAQAWTGRRPGRPANPGLVLYAMSDGGFSVWDPSKNYWRQGPDGVDVQDRPAAYVFSPKELWDGLPGKEGQWLCNGLIRDWAGWQKEKGQAFENLVKILEVLSPSSLERMKPGKLTRISLDDARDIPTIHMPYGQDVAVLHASSGIRRAIALAYILVWAWEEHQKASQLLQKETTRQVIFLIDEIESHLHPSWQRTIIPSLLKVMDALVDHAQVQLITATHSPMIMASVEPVFDRRKDAWFDLDYIDDASQKGNVSLVKRTFTRQGDVCRWLTSEAFDLKSPRSIESEQALEEAAVLMSDPAFTQSQAAELEIKLKRVLGDVDPFWMRWRFLMETKGWAS